MSKRKPGRPKKKAVESVRQVIIRTHIADRTIYVDAVDIFNHLNKKSTTKDGLSSKLINILEEHDEVVGS